MVEVAYYLMSLIFFSPYLYIYLHAHNHIPEFVVSGQNWVFGIMAVFLGWIDFVLYLRSYMFPTLGLYITMFFEILKTFTRIFSVIFLFLLGYATVFYIIFPEQVTSPACQRDYSVQNITWFRAVKNIIFASSL